MTILKLLVDSTDCEGGKCPGVKCPDTQNTSTRCFCAMNLLKASLKIKILITNSLASSRIINLFLSCRHSDIRHSHQQLLTQTPPTLHTAAFSSTWWTDENQPASLCIIMKKLQFYSGSDSLWIKAACQHRGVKSNQDMFAWPSVITAFIKLGHVLKWCWCKINLTHKNIFNNLSRWCVTEK